jgi:uncharacterized metal-binding protein YceD (DUF177 family)
MERKQKQKPLPSCWSFPVPFDDISEAGGHYELTADAPTRDAVAKLAGLRSVGRLEAVFDVAPRGAGMVVTGMLKALVSQTCVVTLDPIENEVAEAVDLLFAPGPRQDGREPGPRRRKKGDDPPEPLVNGVIDLGAVATEFLILGLDPYPRKTGVEFATPNLADNGAKGPFAALEALKKRRGNDLK